jgi:Zn-dependent M28 family amino/carboxypeptidase
MIRTFLRAVLLLHVSVAFAQSPAVDPAYVNSLIKTLSADDMQGRKTFQPGADKAADFIAAEFKKIGLEPLSGLKDFKQTFYAYQIKPGPAEVKLNGQAVDPAKVMVVAGAPRLDWQSESATTVMVTVSAADNFQQRMGEVLKNKKDALVLVDPAHTALFSQYQRHFSRGNFSIEPAGPSYVLVLAEAKSPDAFSVSVQNQIDKMPLTNVAGMIPGKGRKDEYVVFSGHYDHIGVLPPVKGDSIANGADDDASGTTAVIALAQYFKKLKQNERTLLFVAFTAEEIGGYGSQYFSRQLDPAKVMAMFNIEMIGKESKFGKNAAFITGYDKTDFGKILQKNLEGTEFTFHPDPYPDQNLFYRSDNATLARQGVPAHTISTDQIDVDKFYHSVDDEYETLDPTNIVSTIRAIALSARSIVAGKDTPSRVDTSDLK